MSETNKMPAIRHALPWHLPLHTLFWAPAALAMAALPLTLGVLAEFRHAGKISTAAGSQHFIGSTVTIDGDRGIHGPVVVSALHGRLSGSFPGTVSFRGRKLSLAADFEATGLDVSCAIIEGYREAAAPLTGSYQALR